MNVVTRFAPSPTGFMHIGGVRTALFAYLWARKNKGTFILRIEDTDKEREVAGSIEHIQESLTWLGIDWDFGPGMDSPFGSLIQSERLATYKVAAQKLVDKGLAYPDPYTAEELKKFREQAVAEKRPFLFRDHRPKVFDAWDGKRPLRFKVPEIKRYVWNDVVRGQLESGEEMLDDFILIKGDGYPTYNFAHIIDDQAMQVTHVMRADEFISSMPKFLSLYDALEIPYPEFVTLPPILRDDKTKKLGKRDGAKDILDYRSDGYLPEAMVNFLAFIGWNPGTEQELFTKDELIEAFDISKIHSHGGVVNEEKLLWYNREYLLKLPAETFASESLSRLRNALEERNIPWDESIGERMVPSLKERISIWNDIATMAGEGEFDFFFSDPVVDTAALVPKKSTKEETVAHLRKIHEILTAIPESDYTEQVNVKKAIWDYATAAGRGNVLWPMRYALSGKEKSPDPFTICSIIGKDATLSRLHSAIETCSA